MPDDFLVTVLMPVYNGEAFVAEAVESILNQSVTNFEFLIINDGSRDNSLSIIRNYKDERIRIIDLPENVGLARALNVGLDAAIGKYIVRIDSDDIALPDRIRSQVSFMEQNEKIGASGGLARVIGGGLLYDYKRFAGIEAGLILDNVLIHPTVIIRRSVLEQHSLRYDGFVEDYRLWVKIARVSRLAVIPEVLINYRLSENQFSVRCRPEQVADANAVRAELFSELLGRKLSPAEWSMVNLGGLADRMFTLKSVDQFASAVLANNRLFFRDDLEFELGRFMLRHINYSGLRWRDIPTLLYTSFLSLQIKISLLKRFLTRKSIT